MSNRSVLFGDLSLEPAGVQEMANPSVPRPGNRTRSKRGEKKAGKLVGSQPIALLTESVAPLQATANRWDRTAVQNIDTGVRMVRSLLNKLAPDNFDSVSNQIISWINKPEQERDSISLQQATRLIFEHSITGDLMTPVFAELCRRMMGRISPSVQDGSVRDSEGKPIAGGQLFRKYLLGRCQEDFEQWWSIEPSSATVSDDQGKGKGSGHRIAFDFDAYDAAQKAKQQSLGLIKFVGELFKLKMLTERIMHEHVKRLLEKCDGYKGEKAVEGLRKLLLTIGALLDIPKARARMDVYFQRLKVWQGNRTSAHVCTSCCRI
ncbi:armadillo-type protein [Infundibulicybe gibba]|nr:armadillo-type protein [Infundibulicybe gibba]